MEVREVLSFSYENISQMQLNTAITTIENKSSLLMLKFSHYKEA
ncbi:hypothetical protein ACFY5J_24680 [Peribacillus butanolivorans]